MFGFEKLDVWKLAIGYANRIYQVTQRFPSDERFGLTNQLRRAGVSVSANIAEGSGRGSPKDFGRFIEIAYGSLMETISHLAIAREQAFLAEEDHKSLYETVDHLARMLSRLRTSIES